MFRFLFSLLLMVTAGFLFFYFTPQDIQKKGLDFVTQNEMVPKLIRETASNILYTPAEQREQLIAELETQLNKLEIAASEPVKLEPAKIQELIKRSEETLTQLKAKNTDNPNLASLAVEKLLNLNGKEKVACPNP